jgi:glycosyltransferase involved in cell wall biosynthesis
VELSIIVPVYNVEKYLKKCITSLVGQTLDDSRYEILIVNDGSPDHSQKIIDEYASKHSNIVALVKENGGLSDARNYGLQKAKGRYVAFVDSDDYVDARMYETMLAKAKENDFDMVVCDFKEIYEDHEVLGNSRVKKDLMCAEEVRRAMVDFYPSAWNKLYKKELFEQVQFKKGVWFEDVECLYRLFPLIHSVGVVSEPFYYYIQRVGSISKSTDPRIFHYIDNWNGVIDYYEKKGYMDTYRKEIEYSYVRYLYATFIKASLKYDKETYTKALKTAILEVHKHFPKYRRNGYFYHTAKGIYCILFNTVIGKLLYTIKKQ